MLFEDQGVKYEDVRVDQKEWPALKQELISSGANIWGQLPVVVLNGKTMPQSYAIYRYFARIYELYGSNPEEQYIIDMTIDGVQDAARDAGVLFGNDEAAKAAYWKDKCPAHLNKLDQVVGKQGGPYVLGKKFSLADLCVFRYVDQSKVGIPKLVETYKALGAVDKAVSSRPNIAAYLSSNRLPKN